MSKSASKVLIFIFSLFILLFSLLFVFLPDRGFSEQENRVLSEAPRFTLSSLFSGKFTTAFESYLSDQFPFRDSWITMKARLELLSGKTQNNGVFYCGDDTLIEAFDAPDPSQLETNLDAVNALAANTDCEIYLQLAPSSACIWQNKLPVHAQSYDQRALIDYCYGRVSVHTVDLLSVLDQHRDESIYYRTDHHWTTLGAYYGYTALAEAMGLSAPPLSSYDRQTVSESFYGTTYSSSGFTWVKPDSMETFVQAEDQVTVTNYPEGAPVEGRLYDRSFLEKKDKYSMFFGGNTPLLHIETGTPDKGTLLVLRDSYADCFTPFLFDDFSEIWQIDLRYYKTSLASFIEEHGIDTILLCYGAKTFATDSSLFLLGR